MQQFTDDQIEQSRIEKGVPTDWEWHVCAADCGDLVWVERGIVGGSVVPVCSPACALEFTTAMAH